MKELFEGCEIPQPSKTKSGCTSTWGENQYMSDDCISSCKLPDNIKSKCKCYSNYELDEMNSCLPGIKNSRLIGDQFCAYVDDDGTLIGCGAGCCPPDGCPGQCCKAAVKPPDAQRPRVDSSQLPPNPNPISDLGISPNVIKFSIALVSIMMIFSVIIYASQKTYLKGTYY